MKCYSTLLCEHEERDITHYTGERTKKEAKQKQQETQNWTETQWKIQRVRTTDCRLLYGREAATEQHFLPRRSRHRDTRSFVPTNNSLAVSSDTDQHKNSIFTEREKADSAKEKQQRACNWTELSQVLHLCGLYATARLSLTVNCCCITQVCSGIYCILCSANSAVMSKIRIHQLQKLPMFKTVIWLIAEAKTPREPCVLLLFILFTPSFVPEKQRLKNVLKSFWRQCHEVTLSLTEHKVIDHTNLWKKMYTTFHRKHGYLYSQIQSTSRVSMSVSEREISASPVSSLITVPVW